MAGTADRPNRIGFDATRALGNTTGLGNYARQLIAGIAAVAPERELGLYSPRPPVAELTGWAGAIRGTIELPSGVAAQPMARALWRTFLLGQRLAADGVDIYHGLSHEIPRDLPVHRIRSVVSVPDLLYLTRPGLFSPIDRNSYLWRYRWSARNADAVIAISQGTARDLTEHFEIDPGRIVIVPPAVDPAFLAPPSAEAVAATRHRHNLGAEYLVAVGTLEPRKNQALAVEALAILGPGTPQLLLIGGDGGSAIALAELARKRGVADRVRLLTDVGADELPPLVAGALIANYLSTAEGFGLPIVEAMGLGVPVVATSGGNLEDAGGSVARYVAADDPAQLAATWRSLLDDSALRRRLRDEGVQHAAGFERRGLAQRLLNIYDAVWRGDPLPTTHPAA